MRQNRYRYFRVFKPYPDDWQMFAIVYGFNRSEENGWKVRQITDETYRRLNNIVKNDKTGLIETWAGNSADSMSSIFDFFVGQTFKSLDEIQTEQAAIEPQIARLRTRWAMLKSWEHN
jgi:hypothetical protein